jgi:hypothetical protein
MYKKKYDFEITRTDILNQLIKKHKFKHYLEIGVRNPDHNFNKINIKYKIAVDPNPLKKSNNIIVKTSDDFFKHLSHDLRFDIIFIDGLHLEEQVDKDIENSLKHLNKNGFIVLHDCNPLKEKHQRENFEVLEGPKRFPVWNGTVWKSIAKLRMSRIDLEINVVDDDWGVGIINKTNIPQELFPKSELNYKFLVENRKDLLNLINKDEFNNKYIVL